MNKFLIVLLLVCLVSVHAFVKRDAPEAAKPDNQLENIQKQVEEMFKAAKDKVAEAVNPDNIKDGITQFTDTISKAFDEFKKSTSSATPAKE